MSLERGVFREDSNYISKLPPGQQEVAKIFQEIPEISLSDAGKILGGITKQAVSDREKRARQNIEKLKKGESLISRRPEKQPEQWQLDVLKDNPNLGIRDLASLAETSPKVARRWIGEHEIPRIFVRKGRPSKEVVEPEFVILIKDLNAQGLTSIAISEKAMASCSTVSRYLKKAGVTHHRGRPRS